MIRRTLLARRPTRTIRGLGMDYYDLLAQVGMEQCDPRDSACTLRNEERTDAVRAVWAQYMSSSSGAPAGTVISVNLDTSAAALSRYMNNQVVDSQSVTVDTPTAAPVTYTDLQLYSGAVLPDAHSPTNTPAIPGPTPAAAAAPAVVYTPRLTFTNTSGGSSSALVTGDYWRIAITGGAPNTPVYVTGGLNGSNAKTAAGSTDTAGNFTLTGQVGVTEIGAWSEQWSVGSTPAGGRLTFTVTAAPAPQKAADTGGQASGSGPAPDSGQAAGSGPQTDDSNGGSQGSLLATIAAQPWYVLAGGAVATVIAARSLFGGRR